MVNPFSFLFPSKNGKDKGETPMKSETTHYTKEEYDEKKKKREEGMVKVRKLHKEITQHTQTLKEQNGLEGTI